MQYKYRKPTTPALSLLPVALAFAVSGAAVAAEVTYDPKDDVKFTYCYAHKPVLFHRFLQDDSFAF